MQNFIFDKESGDKQPIDNVLFITESNSDAKINGNL